MPKFIHFCKNVDVLMFLKIAIHEFEAEDFLNIFLRFGGF